MRRKHINDGRGNMPWATALSVGLLALGLGACQRERAQMDTESAANTPATTPAPTTPADTTGSDTATTVETRQNMSSGDSTGFPCGSFTK